MKKVIKITFLSLILLFGFMFNIKADDFCQTGQEYFFDCKDVAIQCTYKDKNENVLYVNISKSADVKIGMEGKKGNTWVSNWGVKDEYYGDAKKIYENNKKCSDLVIKKGTKYYFTDYGSYSDNPNITTDNATFYQLKSSSTNTYSGENDETIPNPYASYPKASNCAGFTNKDDCKVGINNFGVSFGCAWNEEYKFCSPSGLAYLTCGSGNSKAYDIPPIVPKLSSYAVIALKTATPIVLIIMGMFQLIKAITSQKEDEMKKARGSLIKKLIAAVLIFFTVSIVQFVIKIAADNSETGSLENCLECFLNNDCDGSMYYTDGYGKCYNVSNGDTIDCPVDNY